MLTLSNFLAKVGIASSRSFNLLAQSTTIQRSLFTPAYYGIDKFAALRSIVEKESAKNYESIKSNIEKSFEEPEKKIFTEDLKTLIYLVNTDADVEFIVKAIKKYKEQDSITVFSYRFEPTLVRLLCHLNKIDLGLEFIKTLNFVETSTTFYMAMNKLMEEKRYEEVAQLGRKCLSDYESKPSDMSFTLRNDLGKLYSNALLEINDASALDQAKHLVQTVSAHKQQMGTQSICALFALATQQKDYDFAFDLCSFFFSQPHTNRIFIGKQIKAIALTHLGRLDEAIDQIKNYDKRSFVFQDTIDTLKKAATESGVAEHIAQVEQFEKEVTDLNKLSRHNLSGYSKLVVARTVDRDQNLRVGGGGEGGRFRDSSRSQSGAFNRDQYRENNGRYRQDDQQQSDGGNSEYSMNPRRARY